MQCFPAHPPTVTVTDAIFYNIVVRLAFNILPLKRLGLHKVAQRDHLICTLLFLYANKTFFLFIYLKAVYVTGQNDRRTEIVQTNSHLGRTLSVDRPLFAALLN